MIYPIIFVSLIIFLLLYFRIADKYNIVDKPNERSSHTVITLRGGGVVYWFTALLLLLQHAETTYLFFAGITIVSAVSFWDDIQSLSNKVRLLAHFTAITIIFYQLGVFSLLPVWSLPILYVIAIGIINAYNFMDGINGITGLYTLAVLGALLYVNYYVIAFTHADLIVYPILASIAFLFFNYRKKAKCFAGDVGSIAIAFWIIFLLLELILKSGSLIWALFLIVYGVDTVCTIFHRLYLKQNIFEAHRLHFYQVLSNEYKIQHRIVALLYALLQGVLSATVILLYKKIDELVTILIVVTPLLLLYLIKFYLLRNNSKI